MPDPTPAERFAGLVLAAHREHLGDVGGSLLHDWAVECGLVHPVRVETGCGPDCRCDSYDGDYPMICYRLTEAGRAAIAAAEYASLFGGATGKPQ